MIILYLVLMDFAKVTGEELLTDVEKSLEIFTAMKHVVVSRRCAELTKEMLMVAKKHLSDAQQGEGLEQPLAPDLSLAPGENLPDNDPWVQDSLTEILNRSLPGWEKADALANLYDPDILEDFTLSVGGEISSVDSVIDFLRASTNEANTNSSWGIYEPF